MMLQGRVALITGGNRGIGAGISRMLAKEGCAVAINYRADKTRAATTLSEIESAGGRAKVYGCDIGAAYQPVRDMVEQVVSDFGRLDILVNNAGMNIPALSVAEMNLEDMRRLYDTNFFGAVHATKAVLPHLRKAGRGDIVFISSNILVETPPRRMPYSASKSAVESLALSVAKEERSHGIRANIVRPGLVGTEMGDQMVQLRGLKSAREANALAPFGRLCQPEDIGRMVAFLCSADGGHITGANVTVDGGGLDWLPPRIDERKAAN